MHIAICDDNISDRKQLERLLERESDARKSTTGILYVDSFGNSMALLNAPMQYDLFFIDMVRGETNGYDLARMLRALGVTAPIVLCSSSVHYESMEDVPREIFYLPKPISAPLLTETLNDALRYKEFTTVHTIEIRCEEETVYVNPETIIYAQPEGHRCCILLDNQITLRMLGSLKDFYYLVESTNKFIFAKKKLILNMDYIRSVKAFDLILTTGEKFPLTLFDKIFLQKYWTP